jgi:hypothetical protein
MKKLLLIACVCMVVASCGMLQPVESQKQYLERCFPNCRIMEFEEMAQVYVVTDTLQCRTRVVEMSSFKTNKIIKIEEQ